MRITIEGTTWTNRRGYGRFLREIVAAAVRLQTAHTFTMVADTSLPDSAGIPGVDVVRVPLRVAAGTAASADGHRSLADMWAMSRAIGRLPADCVFFPTVYSFVPIWTRAPVVVGIHDVIAERLPRHVFDDWRARRFWTAKVWLAARQAARVMTVSQHAADGIEQQLHVPMSRIRIVGEAPAEVFRPGADVAPAHDVLRKAALTGDARFFLYVGGIAPHKNLQGLVDAIASLPRDVRLIIVGDFEHDAFLSAYPALKTRAEQIAGNRIIFAGRLEDEAVAALMRLAVAVVLPSFDEGFGLPAIEAAACGAAVIATRNSAMPEVLGDAAIYVDPYDAASLRDAVARVLSDSALRSSLAAGAVERARRHTWEAAARQMIAMFEELTR